MLDYSYKEIETAVRGHLMVPTRRARFRGSVSLDTRSLSKGDMFIPIKGKRFDGHAFIDEAFDKGARVCLCEQRYRRRIRRKDPDVVFVEDTIQALGRLGAFHRRTKKISVIAVTGSCGKTTTKDLLAHFLSTKFKVVKSEGTENNEIGVPKTLLRLDDHDIGVIELGSNQTGEIRHLARLVDPTHAVITMIGSAHLMGFRSLQGVKREKLSLIDALDDGVNVIVNGEDKNIIHPRMKRMKVQRTGFSKRFDYYAEQVHLMNDGAAFRLNGKHKIITPLLGRHNIMNFLLAAACAGRFRITPKSIATLIKGFEPPKGRIRYHEADGVHWIDDSYNANPSSLKAAIELFKTYQPKGRRILVLGDMLELGFRASAFHRDAGRTISEHPFDMVLTVGPLSKRFAQEAVFCGFDKKKIKIFKTSEEAGEFLKTKIAKSDTVLLKGSRGMRMERVMEMCGAQAE